MLSVGYSALTVSQKSRMVLNQVNRVLELEKWRAVWVTETRLVASRSVFVWVATIVLLLANIIHHTKSDCSHLLRQVDLAAVFLQPRSQNSDLAVGPGPKKQAAPQVERYSIGTPSHD